MSGANSQVAHLAHLGGMIFGFLLLKYWIKNPTSAIKVDEMMKNFTSFTRSKNHKSTSFKRKKDVHEYTPYTDVDQEYNARKQAEQKEVDAILDKIRRNGYDSLTKEEKQKLFDQHNSR